MLARVVSRFLVYLIGETVSYRKSYMNSIFVLQWAIQFWKNLFNLIESFIQITPIFSVPGTVLHLTQFLIYSHHERWSQKCQCITWASWPVSLGGMWGHSTSFISFFGSHNYFYRQTRSSYPSWEQPSAMGWWDWCMSTPNFLPFSLR